RPPLGHRRDRLPQSRREPAGGVRRQPGPEGPPGRAGQGDLRPAPGRSLHVGPGGVGTDVAQHPNRSAGVGEYWPTRTPPTSSSGARELLIARWNSRRADRPIRRLDGLDRAPGNVAFTGLRPGLTGPRRTPDAPRRPGAARSDLLILTGSA